MDELEIASMHPDDIADELTTALMELSEFRKRTDKVIRSVVASLEGLANTDYPYTCYKVPGQSSDACKLTSPSDLPAQLRDIYKIDSGLDNLYARKSCLLIGVQACVWARYGKSGVATVSGMSAMKFNTTRPSSPTSQHNKGRAFDVKLQG
jgi:hypothetical protein